MFKSLVSWIKTARDAVQAGIWLWGLVGAALLGSLRKYWPEYGDVAMAMLVGFAAAATIAMLGRAAALLRAHSPRTDRELELAVRDWSDRVAQSVRRIDKPDRFFAYALELHGKINVLVERQHREPHYLLMSGALMISSDVKTGLEKLSSVERQRLMAELRVEVSRRPINWGGFEEMPNRLVFESRTPIATDLGEHDFVRAVRDVQSSMILIKQVFALRFTLAGQPQSPAASSSAEGSIS